MASSPCEPACGPDFVVHRGISNGKFKWKRARAAMPSAVSPSPVSPRIMRAIARGRTMLFVSPLPLSTALVHATRPRHRWYFPATQTVELPHAP